MRHQKLFKMKKLMFILLIGLVSCNDQTLELDEKSTIEEKLKCKGFHKPFEYLDDGQVTYDSDGLVFLQDIEHDQEVENFNFDFSTEHNSLTSRQKAINSNGLVSINTVNSIKYFIDPSIGLINTNNGTWTQAIIDAANDWTNIANCRVSFIKVTTFAQAQVGFFADNSTQLPIGARNLPNGTFARACFPSNGLPGKYISINDLFENGQFFSTVKRDIMRHEIGHTLGLHHTENPVDPYYVFPHPCGQAEGSNLIIGTSSSDNLSVMNAATCGQQAQFSSNDIKAAQFLYPDNYMTPEITNITSSNNGSTVTINTKTITGQMPYRVIVLRYNTNNQLQQSHDFFTISSNQSFSVACPVGVWLYKITYINYGTFGYTSKAFPVVNGNMEIKRKDASSLSIDAKYCGNDLQLYDDLNNECQRYTFQLQTDGYYEIKRYGTNQNFDVYYCGGAGTPVRLWEDYSNNCQRWKLSLETDGFFEIKNKENNLNLDAAGCGNTAGTGIILWNDTNENCQRWSIFN